MTVSDLTVSLPIDHLSDVTDHNAWRRFMAERIAMEMDYETYGVRDVYLIGSAKSGKAEIGSDIDLIIYMDENTSRQQELLNWLNGWSLSLALMNYLRTGYLTDGLLDVRIITDRNIREQDSFVSVMRSASKSARLTRRC